MQTGRRIKALLEAKGMSQAALARAIGVKPPTISDLIRGESRSSKYLHLIARVLETTPEYLAGEHDDPILAAAYLGPRLEPHGKQGARLFKFTDEEESLVDSLRALEPEARQAVKTLINSLRRQLPGKVVLDDRQTLH